jgi:hypothetical protein
VHLAVVLLRGQLFWLKAFQRIDFLKCNTTACFGWQVPNGKQLLLQ